jgi:hypothetical protein
MMTGLRMTGLMMIGLMMIGLRRTVPMRSGLMTT